MRLGSADRSPDRSYWLRFKMERQALVIIALIAGVIGGPISQDKGLCAKTCSESSRFDYETGKTYEFSYKADTLTTLAGAAEEHSSLHIRAIADIEVQGPCDFVLKLRNTQLEESDPRDQSKRTLVENNADFARALEAAPLSFAFQDGRVETLCASTNEPTWVLNIKRGILSAFQNNMPEAEGTHTVKETDVAGNCESVYSVTEKKGSSVTMKRSKNLLGCTERNNHVTAFQATPYKVESAVQSLPLMKSHHDCVQTVTAGVLHSAECTEKHIFRPFSNSDNGALTHSVQKMELTRHHHSRHHKHHGPHRRTNMLFEHAESQDGQLMERTRAKQTLEQICNHEDMRPHTAQLFSQLTYNLRQLDTMSLSELHQEVHDSRVCSKNHQQAQKFFRDAIPMLGTSASISLIRDHVMNAEVTGMEADQWLTSLAFIAKPNADMIREIRPLLEAPTPSANMLLAVSAMTNTFCRTSGNCADNMDVQDMVRLLANNLKSHCNGDRELVLMSLKALGNLGQGQIVSTLARCAAHSSNPTDVRVAAMSASRSMPCSQTRRAFLDTFANAEEDSEIRINAYLASMACPSPAVISVVKRMLEKEEVNQVGSFVWTHLTNLQETTDPFKEEIKDILQDEELKKTFDMDTRKFSRNYEGSMFFDSINTGAKMESNMIWSSKSYVPRSGMLNLTVDLFGHSVNLMELGGRVEGMEHLIESLFGSEGYFPENAVSTALKRARRSTSDEKLNRVEDRFAENAENTPRGSMYMKVFGNELRYVNLDSTTLSNPAENINLLDILLKLSRNQEADFSKSFMFLDSTLTVPTIVGVPMKLSVNGTATVKLALGGKMDVRQAAASPRSLNIDGYVKPSGAIEMSSMMSVDAFVARTGLKMVSTLHTSTELNGQVSVQDSQVVLGKLNMPRDKIEVVSVESKFFVVHREMEREQKMLTEGRYTKAICTGAILKKTMGVELCGELEFPRSSAAGAPYFPFTGPSGLKVFLNKADTHSSYDFEARLQTVRERHSSPIQSQVARLSFNTPGSQVNRELYTDVILNHMDKSLNANLRSPWKKAVVTGALVNEEAVKRAALTLTVDEQHEYSINSHVKIAQRGNKMVLTPTLEVSLAGLPTMTAQGSLRAVPGDMVNGEVTIENVFKKPLTLKGGYDKEVRKNGLVRYSSNLEVRTDSPLVKATASVDHRDGMRRTAIDVVYRLAGPRHRLRFNGQMKDAQSRQLYTLNLSGDLSSTQFPALDHGVKVNMKHQPRRFEVDANLRYGDDDKTDVRRIILSHESNIRNKPNALNMDHSTKLTWKAMNIDVDSKINHRHSNDEVKTKAIVAYSPGKTVDLDVHFRKEDSSPLIIVADAALSYPGRHMSLHEKLQEKASGYAHEMSLQWQEGSRLTSQGELIISPKNKYDLRLEINPPRMPSTVLTTSNSFNLDDFHTEGTVVHSGAKYSAATSWKYTMMESADAKIDIQYPSRQVIITSMVKATAEAGTYEHDTTVMWDAKRDTSKKMQVSAVFKNQKNKMEGDFNIIHLARKYNMAINSEKKNGQMVSHGELTWAPGKTASLDTVAKYIKEAEGVFALQGSAKFNSPIKYLEKLMASVESTSNANLYNNKMMVSWVEGKEISTVFNVKKLAGWRNIESDLTILNPFTDAATAAVNLNTMDNQLTLHTECSYGSAEKVVLDVSGKNNYPASVEASIKVKTPLRAVRRIGASVDHSLRNGHLSSSINAFINNKKAELAITGKDLSGDAHRDASINVLLKTPFENLEHISAQAKHSKNGHKFSNTLEASLGRGKTISGSLDLVHQSNNQVTIHNGNLRITTPFRNVENLFANWVNDIRSSNVKVSYDIGANSQHMKMDFTHLSTGSQDMASHLQIETPFQAVSNIVVDGLKKKDGDNTKMSLSVSRNNAAVLNINSELKLAEMNFAGQLDMKVLDKSFKTSASLKADTTPYTGHVDLKWNKNSKVALSGDLAINNQAMRGNLLFVSPFQSFERLMMTMDHTASKDRYTSATSFEYASDRKIEIDTMFDKNGGIAYSLALKSPCNYLNVLNIQGEHKQQVHKVKAAYVSDNSRMVVESNVHAASLEDINADIKFTSSMTEDITMTLVNKKVGSEWHTDADLTFAPRQKVEVQTVLSLSPEIKIDLDIKTPFYQFSNAKASFQHSGEQSSFQNRLSFNMMAGGEKTEFTSSAVVNGLRRISGNVKINNPRIAPVDLALNHNMAHGNFHSVLSSGPSKKIDIYKTTNGKKTAFVLKTPFEAMTELQINGEHEVTDTKNSKFDVSMTTYGKTGKLSGHFNVKATDFLDSLLMLETPENTITFLAKHGKFSDKWVSTAAFSYAPEKTIAMELNVNPADQEATLSFNSPFKGFEDLHLMGAAKSTRNMKYGKLQFNTPNKQMMTEMRVRHGKKMALDLKMETPCQYMKSMAIKTSMSGSIDNFKVNAEVSHNLLGGKVDFDAAVKAALDDVDALITFTSPFNGFENLKLKVNHKEQGSRRYTSSIDAGYAANKLIQLRSQLSLSSLNHMQGQITLTTPCPTIRSMQMAFNHDGELTNLKTHFEAQINDGKKSEFDLSFQAADAIRASFKAVTPFEAVDNVDFSFYHSGPISAFETHSELKYNNNQKISTSVNFNGRSGASGRFVLNTPFTNDLIVTINHEGDLLNFRHNSKVEYANKNIILSGAAAINNNIDVQFELKTPFEGIKKVGAVITHKGSMLNFNSGLRMFLNEEVIDAKLDLVAENNVKVEFKLQTPFEPVTDVTFDLSHSGSIRNFKSKAMLTYAPQKSITVEGSFNMDNDLNLYIHILSPFEAVNDMTVRFDHKNNMNGWTQDTSVEHNGGKLVDIKNVYKNIPDIELSSVITSPYEMLKQITFNFNHKQSGQAANTNVIINVNGIVTRGDMTLKTTPQKEIVFRFQSPIPHANDVTLTASADVTADMIYGAVEFNSDDFKGVKVQAEYKVAPEVSGHLIIETPFKYMEKHTAAFTYAGSFPDFRAHAELDLTHVGKMQLDSDFTTSPAVVGQIRFQTPFKNAKEYSVVLNHEGNTGNFKSNIKVASKEHFAMEGQANLKLGYNSEGSVSFTSDLTAMKDFSASFNHKGNMVHFVSHAEATCTDCGKIEVDAKLSETEAEFELKTPFKNIKKYSVAASLNGPMNNFVSKVAVSSQEHFKMEVNTNLKLGQQNAGSISFTSDIKAIKDFSASFSHDGNMVNFVSHAEATCTDCGKIKVDAKLTDTEAEFELKTPFKNIKKYSIAASLNGPMNNFVSKVAVSSQEHFKMEVITNLKLGQQNAGSISFTSDIKAIKDFSASFSHDGNMVNFVSHAEATCTNCGKIEVDAKLTDTEAEFELKTPFKNMKKYNVAASLNGPMNNFVSKVAVSSQEHFKMEVNTNLKLGQQNAGSISFISDIKAIKDFSASFSHDGNTVNFVSHAEATCTDCGKIEVDAKLTNTEAEFELKTPFKNIKKYSIAASLNGPMNNFVSKVAVSSQEHFNMEVNINLKLGQQNAGSISFTSDIKAIKDSSASFSHDGNMVNFVSHAEATCTDCGKIEVDAKLTDTEAEFELKTPFKNMKKYNVAASLNGPMNNFVSKVAVSSQEHFKMEVNTNLKLGQQNAGSISFTSDIKTIKDFSASFSHTGDKNQFTSHAEATCSGCGKIEVDGDFAASPVHGEFKLRTPFKNMEKNTVIFSHEGPANNFKSMLNVVSQGHFNVEVNANLKTVGAMSGGLSFTSDIKAINDFSISFTHLSSNGQFRSHAEAACSRCGKIEVDGDFTMSPVIRGEFKFQSPITNMKQYTVSFNHDGDLLNFVSQAEFKSMEHATINLNGNLKTINGLQGAFAFKSNLNVVNDFSIAFDHSGNMEQFRSHAEFNCAEWGVVSADADFRSLPSIVGNFHLATPMPGMENFRLNIKHNGELDNFQSSAEFTYGYKQAIKASLAAKTSPSVDINIKLETPFSDDIEVTLSHNGDIKKFSGSATLLHQKESLCHYEISFDMTSSVQGSLKLQNAFMEKEAQISFKSDNKEGVFKGETEMSYGSESISTEIELKHNNGIEVSFKINTPWQQVKNVEVDMAHKMWKRRVQSEVLLKHNNQRYEGKINLKFKPVIDGELSLKTPFSQARDISLTIKHQGDLSDFEHGITVKHNGQQKLNGNVNFKVSPRIEGSIDLATALPQMKQLHATIGHSGDYNQFNSHATLSHNGEQKFQGQMTVQTYPSVQAEMKFQTPFSAARDVSASFSHDGSLQRFHSQGVINHNGMKVFNGDVTFTVQPTIHGEMKITTPGNNIMGVMSHDGSLSRFKSVASLTHNGEKKFNTEVSFATQPFISGDLKINTPFSIFRDIEATFSHAGSARRFTNSASISHNGEEKFNSELSFKTNPTIEAKFALNNKFVSAFRQFSAGMSHSGSLKNFVTTAEAKYNGHEAVNAEVSLETSPVLKANFKFETPLTKLQDAGINVKYEGHMMDFVVDASAQYKGEKFVGTLVKFQLEGTTLKTQFNLKTPYTNELNMIYNHEGTLQHFQCHAEVNHMKADFAFAMLNRGMTVTLKSSQPELLDFSANVKYSMNSIKADLLCALGKFDVEGSYKQKPMSVEFRLATPFEQAREVNFDMSHRGNSRALYSSLNMKYNGKNVVAFSADFKNYARTIGNLHFKSMIPYMEKLAASFRHEMSAKGLKSQSSAAYYNSEVSTEADIKFEPKVYGRVTVLTPFNGFKKTSLKFSHLSQQDLVNADAVLKYGAGQEIKINANFDRKPTTMDASIELNTPFRAINSVGGSMNLEGNWQNMKTSSQVFLNKKVIKVEKVYREDNGQPVEASIILYTPFTNLEQTSLQMTDNIEGTRHQPRVVFSWAKQQIQLAGNYNKQHQGVEGSLTLTTPFDLLKQLTVTGNGAMNAAGVNTDVRVNYNGNKVLHTQAEYKNTGNKHNAAFTMITPHPMKTEVEFNGVPLDFTAKASLHWDTRNANKKISTEISHKLEGVKRLMAIRTITANRITGLKTEFEHSASTFMNKVELIWDEANDKKVSYDVSVVAKPTRAYRIYETRARLNTPIRSLEFSLNHKDNGRLYETALNTKWDAVRDASRQLTLNNRYENTGSKHLHQLVISHPKMAKDIVLRNEWSMNVNDIIYSGRTEIDYTGDASDTLTMSTLVQDHSGNYSVELGLSHPQSKLDVKMNSHMLNTPSTFSAAMGVNYMTARRKVNNLSLRGEIEKIRKQLTMELLTPVKKLQLNGKVKENDNMYSVNVVATEDEENQVSAKLNLDTDAQTMDMKAYYSAKNPKNMMHVYGKYIDGNSLVMEATRHHNGEQVIEGQVSMDLKEKHLLHSKVYWRHDAMQDAKFATKKAIKHTRQDVALLLKIVKKSLIKERRAKMDHIRRALPNHKPVTAYLKAEAHSVARDVRVVRKAASAMFDSNEFYVRTAYRFSARQLATVSAALAKVEQAIIEYTETASRALEAFTDKMAVVAADALQVCTEVCDLAKAKMYNATLNARRYLKVAMAKYYQLHNIAAQKYMQVRTYVLAKVDMYVEIALNKAAIYGKQAWAIASDIAVKTQAKIDEYIARLMSCPRVQHMLTRLNSMLNKATSYFAIATERISELLSKINMAAINSVHEVVSGHVQRTMGALNQRAERLLEAASQMFTSMQNLVSQYVEDAVQHENSEHVRRYMQLAINKMSATYTELNVEARTKSLVRDAVMSVVNFVKANSYYIINDYFHIEENKVIEWNPAGGRLEAQVYIPMEAPSMQFVTFVNLPATYRRVKAEVNSLVPEFDYSPMDTYYKYKPSSDVSNWLPPFKAAATLAGRQHYITFDGKHYEFAAPCSYLLARDFIDGNFSMVVNYDGIRNGVSKRSVVVSSSGKDVEIFTDGNFTIAGETSSVPAEWGSTLVTLEDSLLKISDKKGVTVVCDLDHDSCTLHVSGFYFGKMAGLFGTYNNEQFDDFTTAEGTKVNSVSQFAASWAVGSRCARTRNMARVSSTASSRACSQLFHDKNSPLRPCFAIVDPVHFEAMCVNDVMHTEGAECNIASVYVAECRRQEVPVSLPASCSVQSEAVQEAVQENFIEDLEEYVGQKI